MATPGSAHTSERSHIMLLPTGLYVTGGALAVAASVLLVALLPSIRMRAAATAAVPVLTLSLWARAVPSLVFLAASILLIAAGWWGVANPIANPLPSSVWMVWWIGFTIFTALFGNLWAVINPWMGLYQVSGRSSRLRLPESFGQWPAVVVFLAFAWFELVHVTPQEPALLAVIVAGYGAFTFAGIFLFGESWLRQVECFSVYFAMVAKLSPLRWRDRGDRMDVQLTLPGAALADTQSAVTPGMTAFILVALASVSFDGLMRTFAWLGAIGVNPLEFPGRSVVMWSNTAGLLAMAAALVAGFVLALWLGCVIAAWNLPAALAWSMVPIAVAYHLAHYLPEFPVGLLQWAKAISDPLATGADVFGTAGLQPPSSIMMDHRIATAVYRLQTAMIVAGHVIAVIAAHVIATRWGATQRQALFGLAPLNVLMIAYTFFGLWLLATPVAG